MVHRAIYIPPTAQFWQQAAAILVRNEQLADSLHRSHEADWSSLRIVVPTAVHIPLLRNAFAGLMSGAVIPPRIHTLGAWLDMLPPMEGRIPQLDSQRLMALYAELRQHAWLKKLFSAQSNTDLMPLAQTLLNLCDELTQALLPSMKVAPDAVKSRWETAVAQLQAEREDHLLSDETRLVWSIWQSQIDGNDPCSLRYADLMRFAQQEDGPLVWISPSQPTPFEQAFLETCSERQLVVPVMLDWRSTAVSPLYQKAWHEVLQAEQDREPGGTDEPVHKPAGLSLYDAKSLEDEALHGAQTVIDWLMQGKSRIAIVAQDRVVARRIRALLERASIFVSDETGWKLSTTRAAAAVAGWFDVITTRADTPTLLNLLKSPFLAPNRVDKPAHVMAVELLLRRANVLGGWGEAKEALRQHTAAYEWVEQLANQANLFRDRKTLTDWMTLTGETLDALDMRAALQHDPAGQQILDMLDMVALDCRQVEQTFSFAEWRSFIGMQLECTAFKPDVIDYRVVMLPLNGAHLRPFDAVLVVGADAGHLPSPHAETLFFANAVRRELGLETRESRQCQQLRDFTELLSMTDTVVLSWQAIQNGEPNPVGPWVQRLDLCLERHRLSSLPRHEVSIPFKKLKQTLPSMPAPVAPQLLPQKLSASAYNSFVACPYQFFATRMLGLTGMDELSDMPEKRNYGEWLHEILTAYHETLLNKNIKDDAEREALLRTISAKVFSAAFGKNGLVLGYYARWQKAIPSYLEWARKHEEEGWRFAAGEQWLERTLTWIGGQVTLHGRVDRIDENADGERAVLDYKTKDIQSLRDRLKKVEDHQLAFYGLLNQQKPAAGHYVALEPRNSKAGAVEAQNYGDWLEALEGQIVTSMQAIQQGAPLHATGVEIICQYCDVRGLCRKGCW
jgi:ATP-dependent helicase/nuclease subunit B